MIGSLEADAFESLDGAFFALNAPATIYRWMIRTIMPGDQLQTDRIPFDFPRPVEIIGFRSVVAPIPGQGAPLIDPGSVTGLATDLVDVQLDVDNSELLSFERNVSSPGSPANSNFVLLSSVDVQAPALLCLRLTAPRPQLGFTFQWNLGVASPFMNSLVSVAMFVRPLDGGGAQMNKPLRTR